MQTSPVRYCAVRCVQCVQIVLCEQYVQCILYSMYSMYGMYRMYRSFGLYTMYSMHSMCSMYLCTHVRKYLVPSIPNIRNILTNIVYVFGHQSNLDKNSGQNSIIFQNVVAFRVYLMLFKTCANINDLQIMHDFLHKRPLLPKGCRRCTDLHPACQIPTKWHVQYIKWLMF